MCRSGGSRGRAPLGGLLDGPKPVAVVAPPTPARKGGKATPPPSWWATRAREGTVSPGFSKEEILRRKKDDPRLPGGIFERVGGLLSDLLGRS
ncbi:MAG: hypothetical protein ABL994_22220 [Verrucomicrobiales bacterium]